MTVARANKHRVGTSQANRTFYKSKYFRVASLVDQLLSVPLIILSLPILAATALAVRWGSRQAIIYTQERYGMGGKLFIIYKFTTMQPHVPTVPSCELRQYKEFVTNVGRVLRKWRLNELPQLFNVLKGDMRLVGPRPIVPEDAELYELRKEANLHHLKPGLTFIDRVYGDQNLNLAERIKLEKKYIESSRSFWMQDLWILARSVYVILLKHDNTDYLN